MIKWHFAYVICCVVLCGVASAAESLLKPASFPIVSKDFSFKQRVENMAEGYEPYAGMSAYKIIEFESMEDYAHRAIEEELKAAGIEICDGCDENGNPPVQDGSTVVALSQTPAQITAQTNTQTPAQSNTFTTNLSKQPSVSVGGVQGYCSRRNPNIPAGQTIPFGLPVNTADLPSDISESAKKIARNIDKGVFCAPYGCDRGRPHEGVDIGCDAGFYQMPIYATADGVVAHIVREGGNKSAGNYIRIKHANGWTTQYMHLDKIFVAKGQNVSSGCLIGLMGYTGGNRDHKERKMSRGLTHLHYEIIYSGNASYVMAPNGNKIPIVRGCSRLGPCGNFKSKIYPNKIMGYE